MYMFVVSAIIILLSVLAYYLYIRHKGAKLQKIEQGICPECGQKTIALKTKKGGGCSGTSNVTYRCENCGYEEDFNISGSCGSGSCTL